MALSGSYDFNLTRNEIVTEALELIGVYAAGETISSDDMSSTVRTLNLMIKGWQAEGIGLWLNQVVNFTLVEDQESYTIGKAGTEDIDEQRPLEIIEARHRDATTSDDTVIEIISREEYMSFATKDSDGQPSKLYYDPQQTTGRIYIWPVSSNSTDSIYFTSKFPIQDFDAATNNANFPQEWLLTLTQNLSIMVAPKFGVAPSQELQLLARESKYNVAGFDREQVSVFFQPATR